MTYERVRICPACEAACNLEAVTQGRRVVSCCGLGVDTSSRRRVCPKGVAFAQLDADPDRLREPLIGRDGGLTQVSSDAALALVGKRLNTPRKQHGNEASAVDNRVAHCCVEQYAGAGGFCGRGECNRCVERVYRSGCDGSKRVSSTENAEESI